MRRMLLLTMLTLAGCAAVGPDYQSPEVPVPSQWRLADREMRASAGPGWWRHFKDPVLEELIRIALEENKDLKISSARIEEYQARYAVTRAEQFPQIGAEASGTRSRAPSIGTPPGQAALSNNFQIAALLSYEVDLFGRLRRATEAARAELLGTEEGRRTVVLNLVTAVAREYVRLRSLDQQLAISRRTLATRAESLRIAKLRLQAGLTSELDMRQAEAEYQATALQIPALETAIAQQETAISLLLGRNPNAIARGRALDQLSPPPVPAGLPADLLRKRPDLRQAEQQLIAANANIGVARAAYFPTISLTGLLGSVSPQLENLFAGSTRTWNFGAQTSAPIFTAGKITAGVQVATALQRQALAHYEKTIQTAFGDVEDGLVLVHKARERLQIQQIQTESLRRYLYLAKRRYENGYTGYLEVVDAERNLFNAELAIVQDQSDLLAALINLYKAMGGGWMD